MTPREPDMQRKQPDRPGYYWLCAARGRLVEIAFVFELPGEMRVLIAGEGTSKSIGCYADAAWMGPLPMPAVPLDPQPESPAQQPLPPVVEGKCCATCKQSMPRPNPTWACKLRNNEIVNDWQFCELWEKRV
jgi:hypothetical protein